MYLVVFYQVHYLIKNSSCYSGYIFFIKQKILILIYFYI